MLDKEPSDSVLNDFRGATVRASDDRQSVNHRFEKDDAKAFLAAGQNENIRLAQILLQACVRYFSSKGHQVCDSQRLSELLESIHVVSSADDGVPNVGNAESDAP